MTNTDLSPEITANEILLKNAVSDRRQAQLMYWAGYIVTEISRQLDIPVSTIASWKTRDKWDVAPFAGRVS